MNEYHSPTIRSLLMFAKRPNLFSFLCSGRHQFDAVRVTQRNNRWSLESFFLFFFFFLFPSTFCRVGGAYWPGGG